MSVADKDGRMAQWVGDRLTILGMELAENMRQVVTMLNEELARLVPNRKRAVCPFCGLGDGFHDEEAHAAIRVHPAEKSLPLVEAVPNCRACGEPIDRPGDPGCRYPGHPEATP